MKRYPAVKGHNSRGFTDWVFPKRFYLLQCCSCLAVHRMESTAVEFDNSKAYRLHPPRYGVAFRVKRMERETARMRKAQ